MVKEVCGVKRVKKSSKMAHCNDFYLLFTSLIKKYLHDIKTPGKLESAEKKAGNQLGENRLLQYM